MRRALVVVALLAAVAAAVYLLVVRDDAAPRGLRAVGDRPFGDGDTIAADADAAVLGPDGTRLAVLSEGRLGVAEDGRIRPVTSTGSHVVDVAWFGNGATLLVAEGPVPTGGLAVVDVDGTVRGTVPLTPSVGFGTGHGMAVAPGGRRAVVTAVERPALAAEQRHLVLVDLEAGTTTALTPAGGPDEEGPVFLDAATVAYTSRAADGTAGARTVDLASGAVADVAPGRAVGGAGGALVVLADDVLVRHPGGRRLGAIPPGTALTSLDAGSGTAVVVDRRGGLRRVPLDPVEDRSGAGG